MKKKEKKMANEISTTFKSSEPMADAIGRLAFKTDKSKSEIIRACITLSLPILKANNSLIYRVDFSEFKSNKQ